MWRNMMKLPSELQQLLMIIQDYNPLLVGGCVRDHLLGKEPHDFDVVVDKVHHQMLLDLNDAGWLTKLSNNGNTEIWNISKKFPVYECITGYIYEPISFVKSEKSYIVEVLGFRGSSIEEDASNRDLTINSLYYDPFKDKIIDPTGRGISDIENKVIRFNSKEVVNTDLLRIARAYRFAKQLGFTIEDRSLRLCRSEFDRMIKEINSTRIMKEFEKICL